MRASVHVGVQSSLVIEEHGLDAILPVAQSKLLGHAGRKFADFANELSFGFPLSSVQTHILRLNQPGARYFLRGSPPRRRPGLRKPATDRATLPYTGQRYKVRFHARRAPRACST